jgi:hypothetical protein
MAVEGLIAGLVSVSGGAHVYDPWMAFLVGAIASVVFYAGQSLLLLLRIDDACDTAVVHGISPRALNPPPRAPRPCCLRTGSLRLAFLSAGGVSVHEGADASLPAAASCVLSCLLGL